MAFLVKIKNTLFGKGEIKAPAALSHEVLNICIKMSLPYEKMSLGEEFISFETSLRRAKKLEAELKKSGIECNLSIGGLPCLIGRYKKRYGLMAGTIIIAALLVLSGNHIWDIRVSGNKVLTAAEVKAELDKAGFRVGSRQGEKDVDEISNTVLLNSDMIAWLSINFNGNVAYVDIREKVLAKANENISEPANIIASRDGIIEYMQVLRGSAAVKEGESVKEGDLLISGLYESSHGEYLTDHAMGKVYAITNHSFSIKIPLEYDKKELSEPVCTRKTVKFFSKYINIFRKSGNLGASCVKIEEENSFSLFGLPPLPISVISELSSSYRTVAARRSANEASELAFFELENQISSLLSDAELLQKNISTEITDKEFILNCDIICTENIAKSQPFKEE
ncbi:MAG: sporulation protein YqfD [Clostridia bacterium]|nr:sporulation protein YqfD [Clostridia bacterium]